MKLKLNIPTPIYSNKMYISTDSSMEVQVHVYAHITQLYTRAIVKACYYENCCPQVIGNRDGPKKIVGSERRGFPSCARTRLKRLTLNECVFYTKMEQITEQTDGEMH